jgi:hypothetical protein
MGTVSECEATLSLTEVLYKAGVNCRELRDWEEGSSGSESSCDEALLQKLVGLVAYYAGCTDEALRQRDYWRSVSSKLADRFMERDRAAMEQE